jgi:hypothetical protein
MKVKKINELDNENNKIGPWKIVDMEKGHHNQW